MGVFMSSREILGAVVLAAAALVGLVLCYFVGNFLLSIIIPISLSFFVLFIVIALVNSIVKSVKYKSNNGSRAMTVSEKTVKFSDLVDLKDDAEYQARKLQIESELRSLGVKLKDDT